MDAVEIMVDEREKCNKWANKHLRNRGVIPAVIYGKNMEPVPISLEKRNFVHIAKEKGRNTIYKLILRSDLRKRFYCILKDYQVHPVTRKVIHLDFLGIEESGRVRIPMPLRFKGTESDNIKNNSLRVYIDSLQVDVDTAHIPDYLVVDVSAMKLNDVLYARQMEMPEHMDLADSAEKVVCTLRVKGQKGTGMLLSGLTINE